ncbi:MAG: hypothetical protein U0736_26015 [Gemmataceae bacterium]
MSLKRLLPALLAVWGLTTGTASAQYGRYNVPNYGPGYRNNLSPYLNIFRGTNSGIDYYLGTRSEFQRRSNAAEFRGDINDLTARDRILEEEQNNQGAPVTSGTRPALNNTGSFFNNRMGYFNDMNVPQSQNRPAYLPPPGRNTGRARPNTATVPRPTTTK